jgi:hypothetical protein
MDGKAGVWNMRDQFAMAALQGLTSTADEFWVTGRKEMADSAKQAYEWADAMLMARGAGPLEPKRSA